MKFELIAIDGDDTLWENEILYRQVRDDFQDILQAYGEFPDLPQVIDRIEIANLPIYGYGSMSFVLSLVEAAVEMTGGQVSAVDIGRVLELGKAMIRRPVVLLGGVEQAVRQLAQTHPLMLITKGDLRHQQAKLEGSGLGEYFYSVEVVSDKTPAVYAHILRRHSVRADRFLMVGNSLRSDVLPVLELGAWAVYVPYHITWSHEHSKMDRAGRERCFEIEGLGEVVGLVRKIEEESE
jgi:putative hydrolase of the HAD superfamily